jgi:23S rRNA (guanine745-N1)-methyltransferase
MPYLCPVCQSALVKHPPSGGYYCNNKHHFDLAKEGYLNLLPVQNKKSKNPGDSRAMMRARRNFLEEGFYQPMAKAVAQIVDKVKPSGDVLRILDMGCGEGYYCRQVQGLMESGQKIDLHGIDIAKNAILAASKKQPDARFIVASTKKMPYTHQHFDLVMRIYAPADDGEIERVVKDKGCLLFVTPGPRHLWQLREFIYKDVKEHTINIELPKNFKPIETQRVSYTIRPSQEQRMALLQMTPFAWRAKGEKLNNIQHARHLEIETDFILTLAVKS